MKKYVFFFLSALMLQCFKSAAQKILGDCTITYAVSAEQKALSSNPNKDAYKKFYVSGSKALTEISFTGFLQKVYYNENSDEVYILYKMNDDNYMRKLTKKEWLEQYENYKDAKIEMLSETQNILGYTCKKGIATLTDGTKINFYYTPELKTLVSENPYEFKEVNGLILKYEAVVNNTYRITYTASNIDFSPVPAATFIVPKSGYRILSDTK